MVDGRSLAIDMAKMELAFDPNPKCPQCGRVATLFVSHACGAPGYVLCNICWRGFLIRMVHALQASTRVRCRHCRNLDIDPGHIFAIRLEEAR